MMFRESRRVMCVLLLLCAAPVVLASNGPTKQAVTYDQALERYTADLSRPALFIRTRSAARLAATQDPRGFALLRTRYERPEEPADHVRYTTAQIAGHFYTQEGLVEGWVEWLGENDDDADAWLWFWGQRVRARHGQLAEVQEDARENRSAYLRAASIEALGSLQHPAALAMVPEILNDHTPRRGMERSLIIEACASVLLYMKDQLGEEPYTAAAMRIIDELENDATEDRTKLVIARHLREILETEGITMDAEAWRQLLRRGRLIEEEEYARSPTFMGLTGSGDRIAYVIDMSDSMLTPLTSAEREELERVVTPGPDGGENPRNPRDPGAGLPWERINNRFDAAREFLKLAIQQLDREKQFVVIGFGTEAGLLDSTPQLMDANRRNVGRVIQELDAIRPGSPEQNRPHGTLRGMTNLHGGLMRAFRMTSRGLIATDEHVDEHAYEDGIDAVFVLSDGAPSWDDFDVVDRSDPEDMGGDPESGTLSGRFEQLHYYGPYVEAPRYQGWPFHLIEDVRRMNFLRNVEINCVGIGEADPTILQMIVDLGFGDLKRVGVGEQAEGQGR